MQSDMHFYGTYALARMAGFLPDQARTVATAALFVNDAAEEGPAYLGGRAYLLPVPTAHAMLEMGRQFDRMDQWRVWVPFHYLPGGRGALVDDRLVCRCGEPGNKAADAVIRLALKAGKDQSGFALHLLGIVAHAIQDTYAHYGFSGIAHENNRVDRQTLDVLNADGMRPHIAKTFDAFRARLSASFDEVTLLGHAGAATFPDRPYLKWTFRHEKPSAVVNDRDGQRDNPATYMRACTRLHAVFHAFAAKEAELPAPGHLPFSPAAAREISSILTTEGRLEDRCDRWRHGIESGLLFEPSTDDLNVLYAPGGWGMRTLASAPLIEDTDAYRFNRAARHYLETMHDDILPGMGILER